MLLQRITRLDCETCKLRTEHYVLSRDGVAAFCWCLRCGQGKKENLLSETQEKAYPDDDRKPIYLL